MLNTNTAYLASFKERSRRIAGKVSYEYDGELVDIAPENELVSFSIEKTSPDGKFFGFAISQKITIEALGILENVHKGTKLVPFLGIKESAETVTLPNFYVEEVVYNKVKKTTTIVGYDILSKGKEFTINDERFEFTYPLAVRDYTQALVTAIGGSMIFEGINLDVIQEPNFEGSENLQTIFGYIAEYSGTVCYVTKEDTIRFRRLVSGVLDRLTADHYFDLTTGEAATLTKISSASELGDNLTVGSDGFGQVIWNNPFLTARTDVDYVLNTLGENLLGLNTIPYNLKWRGCPAYEIGDRIEIKDKDGIALNVFYLNENLEYNGGLTATSEWNRGEEENVDSSPISLGKTMKQTYAKVDKVNQEIELLVSKMDQLETDTILEEMASIRVTTDSVVQEVSRIESDTQTAINSLSNKVSNTMTPEDVTILIEQEVGDGVTSIITETGYKFDNNGLTVSKNGSEMTTQITEDGMTVSRNGSTMLTANNTGVDAINLRATTYLIVGDTSRFENYYDSNLGQRTGCFWVGN